MRVLEKILGPKSKYDKSIPYTYEAKIRIFEGEEEYSSYFSDTICGLVEYLHQNHIAPNNVKIFEVYQQHELPIDMKYYSTPDHQWLFKPAICRSFEEHYKGHILENSCSFKDRNRGGSGPW